MSQQPVIYHYENIECEKMEIANHNIEDNFVYLSIRDKDSKNKLYLQISNALLINTTVDDFTIKIKKNTVANMIEKTLLSQLVVAIRKVKYRFQDVKFDYKSPFDGDKISLCIDNAIVFDRSKNRLQLDDLKVNSYVSVIIEPYIKIAKNGLMKLVFDVHQLRLNDIKWVRETLDDYSFINSPDCKNEDTYEDEENNDEYDIENDEEFNEEYCEDNEEGNEADNDAYTNESDNESFDS